VNTGQCLTFAETPPAEAERQTLAADLKAAGRILHEQASLGQLANATLSRFRGPGDAAQMAAFVSITAEG
jgi:hypothetical protein